MDQTMTRSRAGARLARYSLEMTTNDVEGLKSSQTMVPLGTSISITSRPRDHFDARLRAAAAIKRLGFEPVPHISARRIASANELDHLVSSLAQAEIDRVFLIAGDVKAPLGPYEDALAILRSGALARYGVRQVGIGGYPEGHPAISTEKLWRALHDKVAAIRDVGQECEIVTQFGFDADPIMSWLEQVRGAGIDSPIRVGLPGPASVTTLLRFAGSCGVDVSGSVMKKYGLSITKLLGTGGPDRLLEDLAARLDTARHGDVRIHLYPFGGMKATAQWAQKIAR